MAKLQGDDALRKRLKAIGDTHTLLQQVALLGVAEAKKLAPVRTGNLRRTIRLGTVTDTTASIIAGGTAGVGYALYVEEGTGLYGKRHQRIYPKRARALAWRAGGSRATGRGRGSGMVFAASVSGRKATPYLVPGVKRAAQRARVDVIIKAWNSAA